MRVRALDANGDYTFGQGQANFLVDSPQCVGQIVGTRLRLIEGEWFLDVTSGTPWLTKVVGKGTKGLYDIAIRQRILDTLGVSGIVAYESVLNPDRSLTVSPTVQTRFSTTPIVLPPITIG